MGRKKNPDRTANYSIAGNTAFLLKDIWQEKRLLFIALLIEVALGSVLPLFGLYLPKIAVDLAVEGAAVSRAVALLGGFAAAYIVVSTIHATVARGKYIHYNQMRTFYQKKMFFKTLDCDYDQIESEKGQTRYSKARISIDRGDWSGTSRIVTSGLSIVTGTASFLLYSGVIARLNLFLVAGLVGISLLNYFSAKAGRLYEEKNRDTVAELEKKLRYIENAAADLQGAKDVRVYTLGGWFMTVRDGLMRDYKNIRLRVSMRHYAWGYVTLVTNLLRDCVSYGYLIYMVTSGQVAPGDAILYFGAIAGFSGWISGIVGDYNTLAGASSMMNDMRDFLEFSNRPDPADPAPLPAPGKMPSVEFRDVCFSYDDENAVLNHFNLTLRAGQKLALVGINGAGKTTIVKLLCGFYRPDSGQILVDGIDTARYRQEDLYKLFSAVFQDISIFPFTAAENISLKPEAETDMNRVKECLDKAGLYAEIAKHPGGLRSTMLKDLDDDGVMLSGGQQQKLLMARALYKDAPILILDEPTAALDPIAESEVYEQFHEFSDNKTAIYISHRLASTRFCDKIAFLQDGEVVELGTHAELMAQNGRYAEMFAIQSHYYKEGCAHENQA